MMNFKEGSFQEFLIEALENTYTKSEADTAIANLVSSAPGTLDTLNELAAALGDDPDFAATVTYNTGQEVLS